MSASLLSPVVVHALREAVKPTSYAEERAEREANGAMVTGLCWYCDERFDPSVRRDGMTMKDALLFCGPSCASLDAESALERAS